jgi:hypothetical protein
MLGISTPLEGCFACKSVEIGRGNSHLH